jgi:hypothetical protein
MDVSRSDLSHRAFVLTEEDVRALSETLGILGAVSYELECSDGLTRKAQALEEVLRFDNSPERALQKLTMSARGDDFRSRVWISLERESGDVYIFLEGPEETILRLNREIESRLAAMRPWYVVFTRGDVVMLSLLGFMGIYVFLVVATAAVAVFGPERSSAAPDPRSSARVVSIGILIAAGGVCLVAVLGKARKWLFPIGAFVLGAGKSRYDFLEKVRWGVGIAFVVSVAASVVAAIRW